MAVPNYTGINPPPLTISVPTNAEEVTLPLLLMDWFLINTSNSFLLQRSPKKSVNWLLIRGSGPLLGCKKKGQFLFLLLFRSRCLSVIRNPRRYRKRINGDIFDFG
ncbi:hypothetical protein TNIN_276801 [Trichonephila inaurata madagascariensis]|uniref:Uncharacterized protein n=1 Tax=Trichonephila inaurata madagascariensis TaxID=2747483 RepID=A0A8X6XUS0_9ARAC|nr:hypothetical protein TNIN_276801 [Trichonephila inaurata madagascariensis]